MTRRPLTPAEYGWARDVFGDTLPPRERILVSPAVGFGRRPFTFPGLRTTTMHLGRQHADPVRTAPELFAHELTHVWQLAHSRHRLWWLAGAAVVQVRYLLGRDVYDPGDGSAPWETYNVEQQATLVGRAATHPHDARLQRHLAHVRAAGPPVSGLLGRGRRPRRG